MPMYYVRIEKQVEQDLNDIIKYTHILFKNNVPRRMKRLKNAIHMKMPS